MYTHRTIYIYIYIYLYIWSRTPQPPPTPPPNGLGSPPLLWWVVVGLIGKPFSALWCGVSVGGNPLPSFSPCGVGCCGWESPFLLPLWCGWEGICGVGFGEVSWWARGGREASLVRQTIFCGRRFCSETLGCPFKCFGRPWRFLLGTIQYRAIKSVLMTSRPPIIDYTLCHILYIVYSRVYTLYIYIYAIDYILCTWSVYIR